MSNGSEQTVIANDVIVVEEIEQLLYAANLGEILNEYKNLRCEGKTSAAAFATVNPFIQFYLRQHPQRAVSGW